MFKIFHSYFITTIALASLCYIAQLDLNRSSALIDGNYTFRKVDEHKSYEDDYKSAWLDYEEHCGYGH